AARGPLMPAKGPPVRFRAPRLFAPRMKEYVPILIPAAGNEGDSPMRLNASSPWWLVQSCCLLLLPVLAGCGVRTGTVSGSVTYKDKPVPGGLVMFVPVDGGRNSVA